MNTTHEKKDPPLARLEKKEEGKKKRVLVKDNHKA